ncbi:hypothetical protein CCM_01062 [Cordyceps militaris CM01]|uniref:Stc1 domain-containing protein n=1 Tax=Cordyceps militaris (strain CM01) TaxID=983644 RepID=G3J2S2_CORMM|nr:uncharacterized protein CCM_01062 [Cordyceps militaris CM01]EGX96406.1 hypothetical protein CCM_01062 [Cordyceps militaris CM01]
MNPEGSSSASAAPTRFRCKVGGEWKNLSDFSNAQQKNLRYLSSGRHLDPAHSGMTCKQHSAGARAEMRCEVCMLVKSIDDFSKNSRRNGESQCRRCVAWTEIQEPGLTPGPLETGHISPEEEQQQTLRQHFVMTQDFFPIDDDDDLPRAPISDFSQLGLDDAYEQAAGTPCVTEFLSQQVSTLTVPRHLRGKAKAVSEAASSTAGSTAGDLSLPTTLLDTDSDASSVVNQSFNAWGPDGEMERRRQPASVADSSSASSLTAFSGASTASVVNDDPNVIGDWSRARSSKTDAMPRRKGGWTKTGEDRLSVAELREMNGCSQQTYARREIDTQRVIRPLGYDDDDSD